MKFIDWLVKGRGKILINEFTLNGEQLFLLMTRKLLIL